MKKMLSIGVLTLASMWLTAGTSSAGGSAFGLFTQASCWPFNCFANCHCCCGGCSNICIRPYNAFSPPCCGTLFTDDLCQMRNQSGCGSAQGALPYGDLPSVGCCDSDSGGTLKPTPERAPTAPTPVAPGTKTSFMVPGTFQSYGPMQIGYYYPSYMPAYNYNTQPIAAPYYWNGSR